MFAQFMRGTNGSKTFDANDAPIELLRAVGLCHPGWTGLRRLTFFPNRNSSPEWLAWKEEVFGAILLPRIQEARSASAAGDWRFLADSDRAMDSALPDRLREASSRAGRLLMEHHGAPKSERLWGRYHALVESEKVPGHLAILCALRGAIFHLPPMAILGSYVFLEAKGGMPRSGMEAWMNMVADCLTNKCAPGTSNLRAA